MGTNKNRNNRTNFTKEQEHDHSRKMMDILRGDKSPDRPINEQEEEVANDDQYVEKDEPAPEEEATELPSDELRSEKQKFRETVDPRVEFETFKLYPESRNVVFAGEFQGFGGLYWQFTLSQRDGVYISVDNLQLSEEAFDVLQKLKGYYDNWAEEWSQKIVEEYSNNNEDEEEEI